MKTLAEQLLNEVRPALNNLVSFYKWAEVERLGHEKEFSAREIAAFELSATIDMLKVVGNYLLPTDQLISASASAGETGLDFKAEILRNGTAHAIAASGIVAGGYNIQKEHIRYIVTTDLRKIKDSGLAAPYVAAKKKADKIAQAETEVEIFAGKVADTEKRLNESDDERLTEIKASLLRSFKRDLAAAKKKLAKLQA